MVNRRKPLGHIPSRDHFQRSLPSQIFDKPRVGFEPPRNMSSSFAEWSCAVVITTTPRCSDYNHWKNHAKYFYVYFFYFLISSDIFIFLVYWLPHELAKLRTRVLACPSAWRAHVLMYLRAYMLTCLRAHMSVVLARLARLWPLPALRARKSCIFTVLKCFMCLRSLMVASFVFFCFTFQKLNSKHFYIRKSYCFVSFNMFFYLHQFYLCW